MDKSAKALPVTERFPSLTRGRIMLLLASMFMFALLSEQYLRQGFLMRWDHIIDQFIIIYHYKPLTWVLSVIGQLGKTSVVTTLALIISAVLLWYRRYQMIIPLWVSIMVTSTLTNAGKNFFLRPRPDGVGYASFPSGHASASAVFYGFVLYLLLRRRLTPSVRFFTINATILLVALIDMSRMILRKHFLTDVLAGNALGFGILLLIIILWEWLENVQTRHRQAKKE